MRSFPKVLDGLEEYFEEALGIRKIPGASIAIVHENDVIYVNGHGVKEFGTNDAVDEHTLFQIGSTTKAFTTAALGVLVDDGKIRWDDLVIDHLPDFQLYDPWVTANLTIRDTVTHRSGFGEPGYYAVHSVIDADEVLRRMRYNTEFFPFRDSYLYSNPMYGVAGKVIEAASGLTWNEFVRSRLFGPLEMTRSGGSPFDFWDAKFVTSAFFGNAPARKATHRDARDPNVAMPHVVKDGVPSLLTWQTYDNMAAAGSIASSASDMANWLIMHVNEGRFQNREVLKKETLLETHSPQNLRFESEYPFNEGDSAHAMGWRWETFRGHTHIAHGGGIVGFPAEVSFLPDLKIGVAVLVNAHGVAPDEFSSMFDFHKSVSLTVFDRFLNVRTDDWSEIFRSRSSAARERNEKAATQLQEARRRNTKPSLPLRAYVGRYADPRGLLGELEISLENDELLFRFPGEGAFSARLEHWHYDTFELHSEYAPDIGGFAEFALDANGTVASMKAFNGDLRRVPATTEIS